MSDISSPLGHLASKVRPETQDRMKNHNEKIKDILLRLGKYTNVSCDRETRILLDILECSWPSIDSDFADKVLRQAEKEIRAFDRRTQDTHAIEVDVPLSLVLIGSLDRLIKAWFVLHEKHEKIDRAILTENPWLIYKVDEDESTLSSSSTTSN